MKGKILIAIIAHNEDQNIESAIDDLKDSSCEAVDIVVIDDGSIDNTAGVAKDKGIKVISHCLNTNNAMNTVSTYLSYAYRHKYDVVCQFDGDGQHRADQLEFIIEPILKGEADYVIGSRFINKKGFQSTFIRRIGITLFSMINSKLIGKKITDSTSGFRAYSPLIMHYFDRIYKSELYDTNQLLLLSHYAGAIIKEVPVEMKNRIHGSSEFSFLRSLLFPLKGLICLAGVFIQERILGRSS